MSLLAFIIFSSQKNGHNIEWRRLERLRRERVCRRNTRQQSREGRKKRTAVVGHSRKQQSKEGRKREQQIGRAVGKGSSSRAFRESSRVRRTVRESSRVGRAVGKQCSGSGSGIRDPLPF
jgi:hypothetical protein